MHGREVVNRIIVNRINDVYLRISPVFLVLLNGLVTLPNQTSLPASYKHLFHEISDLWHTLSPDQSFSTYTQHSEQTYFPLSGFGQALNLGAEYQPLKPV